MDDLQILESYAYTIPRYKHMQLFDQYREDKWVIIKNIIASAV